MTRDKPTRLRPLSDEEVELWLSIAATVVRRPGATLPDTFVKQPQATSGLRETRPAPTLPAYVPKLEPSPAPTGLERKLRQKLARGRLSADAAIDLHGLRQAEAHGALRHFLHEAQREGARTVLVVTGKGERHRDPFDMTGGGVGILKRMVPLWLAQPDLRAMVIGFEEAARPHGGAGALYVRLRRRGA